MASDREHTLTFQFKHKVYGNPDKVADSRAWIEKQIRVSLHTKDIDLELVEDTVKDDTEILPGLEGF